MNDFRSFMSELDIEGLINAGKYNEALKLLLEALEKKNYLSLEIIYQNIAVCYIKLEEYLSAKDYLQKLLAINPYLNEASFNLAVSLYNLKEYPQAIEILEKLSEREGLNAAIAYYLGLSYLLTHQRGKMAPIYAFLLDKEISPDLIYNFGIQMISTGNAVEAREMFVRYLTYAENDIDATFGLGIAYVETKEYRKAIECFSRVQEWDGKRYFSSLIMLGMAYFQIGDLTNAMRYIQDAIDKDDTASEAWYYLGIINESIGQTDKALSALKKAGELNRQMPEIWERLGYIHLNNKQYNEARIYFKKTYMLTKNPMYAYKVGLIYMSQEDYQSAIDYFTLSMEKLNMDEVSENLGICYHHIGKYRQAIDILKPLLEKENAKMNEFLYYIAGSALMKLGSLTEAKDYLTKGLKINQSDINLLYTMGLIEASLGNFRQADIYLEKALIIHRSPEILYSLALAKIKLSELETAIELLEEYRMNNELNADILYKLGLLYVQARNFPKAKEVFGEVLKINPDNEQAVDYLRDMEKLHK